MRPGKSCSPRTSFGCSRNLSETSPSPLLSQINDALGKLAVGLKRSAIVKHKIAVIVVVSRSSHTASYSTAQYVVCAGSVDFIVFVVIQPCTMRKSDTTGHEDVRNRRSAQNCTMCVKHFNGIARLDAFRSGIARVQEHGIRPRLAKPRHIVTDLMSTTQIVRVVTMNGYSPPMPSRPSGAAICVGYGLNVPSGL